MDEEAAIFRQQWKENHLRMDECEKKIKQEVVDRIKYHDYHLNPIRAQIKTIQKGLIEEKKIRVTNEKKVIKEIKEESQGMQDDIANENRMRVERMQDLDD